ncbi:MAG: DUF1285 domain-containing protein [Pseudomonadales bacterium]|nr:DUF1285 domain-containing protein [Pseudomonadales bacterium]
MLQLSLEELRAGAERAASGVGPPPVEHWDPPLCGDIDIRIARDGTWFHEGAAIERQALVRLFAGLLKREGDEHFLVTPAEKWRVQVEDAPFVLVALEPRIDARGWQQLVFFTNVGDPVIAGPEHPLRMAMDVRGGPPSPYLLVRRNLEGLVSRPVYYQLAELAEPAPDGEGHGVTSSGIFFPLH